jgi:hypothetical protein
MKNRIRVTIAPIIVKARIAPMKNNKPAVLKYPTFKVSPVSSKLLLKNHMPIINNTAAITTRIKEKSVANISKVKKAPTKENIEKDSIAKPIIPIIIA